MTPRRERPHVLMMSEITADGKLTLKKGASSKILMKYMAPETEILLHETRADYDAIMVGANTIKIDNSFLTVRLVPGKSPLRVIPNSMADIPPDANVLKKDAPTVIAVARRAPPTAWRPSGRRGWASSLPGRSGWTSPSSWRSLYRDHGVKKSHD